MTKRIAIMGLFLAGCAVGGVSSQLVVPKANAQVAASNWEYRCWMGNSNEIAAQANKLGSEAWEMVGLTFIAGSPSFQVCFKRPRM
jgi:hypothetical protein